MYSEYSANVRLAIYNQFVKETMEKPKLNVIVKQKVNAYWMQGFINNVLHKTTLNFWNIESMKQINVTLYGKILGTL